MNFYEILDQIVELLQRRKRVTYRTLQREFKLDETSLTDLKEELLFTYSQIRDEEGHGLIWGEETSISTERAFPEAFSRTSTPRIISPSSSSPTLPHLPDERRQVTIVFADISGFTALSEQMDPEAVRTLMNACFAHLVPIIERYGGIVDKYIGDEIMALFGAPIAHDNDAERAVRAALEMMEALPVFNASQGTDLGLHCGINTGIVIAGQLGTGTRQEYSVMGDAVNLAARLEDASERGQIFVGPATYRLTQAYFIFEVLEPMTLKGKADPVPVFQVRGLRGSQHRPDRIEHPELTPFVGREAEVNLLLDHWERATQGIGHVVLLSGEAGIGKSRLLRVLKDRVRRGVQARFECRCSPYHQQSAFYPIIDLWQRLLQWEPHEEPAEKLYKLETVLNLYSLPLTESVSLFAALLSLPVPEERYPPLPLSPNQQRQRIMELLIFILQELASQRPVLFTLEDVHWADPSTLEFLQLVIDQTPTFSLLTILTYRPVFQPPWASNTRIGRFCII